MIALDESLTATNIIVLVYVSSADAAASFVLNRGAGNYAVSGPAARTAYHDHVQVEVTVELD